MSDGDSPRRWTRRTVLGALGTGAVGLSTDALSQRAVGQSSEEATLRVEDQESDGDSIVVAEVSTPEDCQLWILTDNRGKDTTFGRKHLDAGTTKRELTVELDPPISHSQLIVINLFVENGDDDYDLARTTATVAVGEPLENVVPELVEANPDAGFNYPYFLYDPPSSRTHDVPLLVEPNNTGEATDDFSKHREDARETVDRGVVRAVSDELGVPLLVPIFPRSWTDPVDWKTYTHLLDRDTLAIEEGPLERIDLQLLSMVDHAREHLANDSRAIDEQILMNGFSASGNFVDRFTVLHPERVRSVTAGGLNGMPILPLKRAKGHTLDYHLGIADVEELTGKPVNLEALDATNQYLYMGDIDFHDILPYRDAWTSEELKQTALDVYGHSMIDDRFPFCQSAYEKAGVTAQFHVYDGVRHNPRPAKDDLVEFHRRSIEGEDVSDMGQELNGPPGLPTASFDRTPETPVTDESVSFDATSSTPGGDEILSYSWKFGDGTTAAGTQVEHTFASAGEYPVRLKVVDDLGIVDAVTTNIEVSEQDRSTANETTSAETDTLSGDSETSTSTDSSADRDGSTTASAEESAETTGGPTPGFGIGVTAVGVAGGAYLLDKVRGEDDEK